MIFSSLRQLVNRLSMSPRRGRPHSFRPRLEILEDQWVPATITWNNPQGGDWATASNWMPAGAGRR